MMEREDLLCEVKNDRLIKGRMGEGVGRQMDEQVGKQIYR